jgi:hypothetical protein
MVDTVIVENEPAPSSAVSWSAILAGAAVSAGLSLILLSIGSGIGFSVANPWSNTTVATTTKAATVAGIYLTVTAVIASAVGGYLAGRLRHLWLGTHPDEAFFRDTAHGLITWAVATVASIALLGTVTSNLTGAAVRGAGMVAAQEASAGLTDQLFAYDYVAVSKAQGNLPNTGIARDYNGDRAVAARLLGRLRGPEVNLTTDERQNLAVIVAARRGEARGCRRSRCTRRRRDGAPRGNDAVLLARGFAAGRCPRREPRSLGRRRHSRRSDEVLTPNR